MKYIFGMQPKERSQGRALSKMGAKEILISYHYNRNLIPIEMKALKETGELPPAPPKYISNNNKSISIMETTKLKKGLMIRTRFGNQDHNQSMDSILEGLNDKDKNMILNESIGIQSRLRRNKKDSFEIGKSLSKMKQKLQHGQFYKWIKAYFGDDLPESTAYFYMRIYETFKDHSDKVEYFPTKYMLMITNKKFPGELIKELQKNVNELDRYALTGIEGNFKLLKKGKTSKNQYVATVSKIIKQAMTVTKDTETHRINRNMRIPLVLSIKNLLGQINDIIKKASDMAGLYPFDPDSEEHRELITDIGSTIEALRKLKITLEDGTGFFKSISTSSGNKFVANL